MDYGVLGPLAVTTQLGEPVKLGRTKRRLLLVLVVHRDRFLQADAIADLL